MRHQWSHIVTGAGDGQWCNMGQREKHWSVPAAECLTCRHQGVHVGVDQAQVCGVMVDKDLTQGRHHHVVGDTDAAAASESVDCEVRSIFSGSSVDVFIWKSCG